MKNTVLMVTLSVLFLGCMNDKQPKEVIEKEKFESLYVELLDSGAVAEKDSARVDLSPHAERILARRDISLKQLKATVNYYNEDSKRWKQFYEDVVKKVNEQSAKNATR